MESTIIYEQYADLVQKCREGDSRSFRQLYDHYSGGMYNTSLRIVNNAMEAEDILQESFMDAFRNIHAFENRSSFGAWLKQIVINKSINLLKKKKITLVEADADTPVYEEADEAYTDWKVQQVKDAIKKLPDGYRTTLTLYLLEGYDHEEIAEIMGVAESTTRTQYIRAKKKLLEMIKNGSYA